MIDRAAISVTLGLPGAMDMWSNQQVLKFIRVMWDRHRRYPVAGIGPDGWGPAGSAARRGRRA